MCVKMLQVGSGTKAKQLERCIEVSSRQLSRESESKEALLREGYLEMAKDSKKINKEWEVLDVIPPEY